MNYRCRCEDGPAKGAEFQDYGPPVKVDLPHEGRVIEYRLSDIVGDLCLYHCADSEDSTFSS